MALENPAFRSQAFTGNTSVANAVSVEELQDIYNRPTAGAVETDRMTVEDTVVKTGFAFGVLVLGAMLGWVTAPTMPAIWMIAGIIGFVLAMVNIFKKEPSPALILAYAAAQGVFVGAISFVYEVQFEGIVLQAVLATLAVVGVTLALFASGKIRASKKATKIFLIAMVGYLVYSVLNVILSLTGVVSNPFGLSGMDIPGTNIPVGVVLGILVVIMGAYSLVLDFDFIQQGVKNRAPRKYAWTGAFGIMVTVIWLYMEILRMLAILRGND
ncbi:putative YccA/Bax inhibitor family protein [Microterricola gilva]|uniref:Putative YccA/Bax inhibitor family protein n=1 Tax=Microterricola gilva TaxID=393267 RepID=A0A4Q8AIE6_9MICO|nr:Bax inhibitor-1/YccA family protein [Microterricola gilva]RZU64220.1 putative YccA/Bax inhibitor family protein [Microterricola gilva]